MLNLPKRTFWKPIITLDVRSLALMRVLLAIAILMNIASYAPYISTFFAPDTGIYSIQEAQTSQSRYRWSVFYIADDIYYVHALFVAYTLAALCLLFGIQTRTAIILCWIFSASLRARGLMFTSLADTQLCIYLFWAMFLPLGERFSVDAALKRPPATRTAITSVASLGLIANVSYVYLMGALEKTGAPWHETFTAIFLALSQVETATPLNQYGLMLGGSLQVITFYIYYLELLGAALLCVPGKLNERARMFLLPQWIMLHVAFLLFLSIGFFPVSCIAGLCALLPARFWDTTLTRLKNHPSRQNIAIYYDRDCGFCLKMSLIFRELCALPIATVSPAQDDATAGPILEQQNSWVVKTDKGDHLTRWDAVSYLLRRSPLLFPFGFLFMLPPFKQFGTLLYLLIAHYRPQLGRISATILPFDDEPPYHPARPTQALLLVAVILILGWNLKASANMDIPWSPRLNNLLHFTALTQEWNMYSPNPRLTQRWFRVYGTTVNGEIVDLHTLKPTTYSSVPPNTSADIFSNFRWRKFYARTKWKTQGPRVVKYYCERWNQHMPASPLKEVNIQRYLQPIAIGDAEQKPARHKIMYKGKC